MTEEQQDLLGVLALCVFCLAILAGLLALAVRLDAREAARLDKMCEARGLVRVPDSQVCVGTHL